MTLNEQIQWCKAQIKAGYEVIAVRSILNRLKDLEKPKEPPHEYHQHSVAAYMSFLKQNGLPPIMEPMQGKALKELLPKLQQHTTSRSAKGAYDALVFIFTHWERLNNFHQKKKTLSHINKYLVEILDQIRNGATKQQSAINKADNYLNQLTKQ